MKFFALFVTGALSTSHLGNYMNSGSEPGYYYDLPGVIDELWIVGLQTQPSYYGCNVVGGTEHCN
jgi:hypothetical protein